MFCMRLKIENYLCEFNLNKRNCSTWNNKSKINILFNI